MEQQKKKLTKKKMLLMSLPLVLIIVLVVVVKIKYSFFNKVKQKVVESNYTCSKGFELQGNKCISIVNKKSVLLGNVNLDNEINQNDVQKLEELINSGKFEDLSYSASDLDRNGLVDATDLLLMEDYINNNHNDYDIGVRTVCAMDIENTSYYLSDKQNNCIQVIVKDADKKGENDSNLEMDRESRMDNSYTVDSTLTVSRDFDMTNDPDLEIDSTDLNVDTAIETYSYQPYINTSTHPSTHSYNVGPSTGYNTYDGNHTNTYTYNDYDTYSTASDDILPKEKTSSKGKVLYANGSLIRINEVDVPELDKEHQYNDNLKLKLNVKQTGTGLYYYTVAKYSSTNNYNGGYLNSVSRCKRLSTNKNMDLDLNLDDDNKHLELNIYADSNCRSQKIVAKYISGTYRAKTSFKAVKNDEKVTKVNDDVRITVVYPSKIDIGLYKYRVKYSIASDKKYYAIWREYNNSKKVKESECLKLINGMNQIYSINHTSKNQYGEITLYEDNKCHNIIKTIKSIDS